MRRKLFGNIGLKMISAALALSLWFFVTYRGQSEMAIDASIEFKNIPKGIEMLKQNVRRVNLNISGHERILKTLRPMDVRVVLDLSEAKKGEAVYFFDINNIIVPRTIKVLRMEPTSIKVVFDEYASKTVPVKAHITGAMEKGYRIKSIEVKPSTVGVEGARTEVNRIALLRTEQIDITGLDTGITQDVRLNLNGKNIRTKASEVTVKISVERTSR
ncbi:MAG: YbbR-like domain-containing protein [Nitrospirae bacterium]|nr:YbbR-like domain-containing protein [Nitrospirota bacterium]